MRLRILALALLAAACAAPPTAGDPPAPDAGTTPPDAGTPAIATIEVGPDPDLFCTDSCREFDEGQTRPFVATAFDQNHQQIQGVAFTWSSADETIATVDEEGRVRGAGPGTTDVIAKAGGVEGRTTVTIHEKRVWNIVLTPDHADLAIAETLQFTAEAQDQLGLTILDAHLVWSVGDTSIATISDDGLLTAKAAGSTLVQVTTNRGGAAWAAVTVTGADARHGHAYTQIATGDTHACGLEADGTASCWGWNFFGQLGDGNRGGEQERFPTPAPVKTSLKFKRLALAGYHACGLAADDTAWCWGSNDAGAIGVDDVPRHTGGTTVPYPMLVAEGVTFTELAGGLSHTCALDTVGIVWCTGAGFAGQNGSTTPEVWILQPIASAATYAHLTAGMNHTCALTAEGAAYCWGSNSDGQLGSGEIGDGNSVHVPVPVQGNHVFSSLYTRGNHTCGVDADGTAWCWGRNDYGQLGNGMVDPTSVPTAVTTELKFKQIVTGAHHSCGLQASGEVFCWGNNTNGQLGTGTLDSSMTPVALKTTLRFAALDAGPDFTCGVTTTGEGWCWGTGYYGSLGNGQGLESSIAVAPVPVLAPGSRASP